MWTDVNVWWHFQCVWLRFMDILMEMHSHEFYFGLNRRNDRRNHSINRIKKFGQIQIVQASSIMLGYCFQLESRQKSLWKYFNRDTIKTAAWYLSAVNIELSIINYVVIHTNHNSWESPLFLGVHFYFSSLLVFFSVGCVRSVGRSVGRRGQVVIVICIVPMPYNAQWTTMRLHNT